MMNYIYKVITVIIIFSTFVWIFWPSNSAEPSDDWEYLFNGKDLDGWTVKIKGYPSGENFGNTFKVKDGEIQVSYENYENFDFRYGHLYYTKKI